MPEADLHNTYTTKLHKSVSKRVAEKKHINLLEAEALLLGLRTFREFLTGKTLHYSVTFGEAMS